MKHIFVSRHPGARTFALRKGIRIDETAREFSPSMAQQDIAVYGTLPAHLIALVCEQGGIYRHLVLDTEMEKRGKELTAEELEKAGAHFVQIEARFVVDR